MTPQLTPPLSTALLLVVLEHSALRSRIETALVLLGHPVDALDRATALGLVRAVADRLEVVDIRLARYLVSRATEREGRLAHLALACSRSRPGTSGRTSGQAGLLDRSAFDRLCAALEIPLVRSGSSGGGAEPLTARERDVAELAATGLQTREIAESACLSQKTVEYHLTRVYRKLGVRSKSELAFAFAGDGGPTAH